MMKIKHVLRICVWLNTTIEIHDSFLGYDGKGPD